MNIMSSPTDVTAPFTVCTLASSSKGNAVYVRYGQDEILIDAGISMRRLECSLKSLGTSLDNIRAVFITHEHIDHVMALETLTKHHNIPIHFTETSAKEYFASGKHCSTVIMHPTVYTEQIGKIHITSFATPHDSAASVGYIIGDTDTAKKFAIATDIGHIDASVENALIGAENVILESNHDEAILLCGSYPYSLKRRILSSTGHLSNNDAADFALKLAQSGTKRILLAHLSPENNYPELALTTTQTKLAAYKDIRVQVAAMSAITCLV